MTDRTFPLSVCPVCAQAKCEGHECDTGMVEVYFTGLDLRTHGQPRNDGRFSDGTDYGPYRWKKRTIS